MHGSQPLRMTVGSRGCSTADSGWDVGTGCSESLAGGDLGEWGASAEL